MVVAVVVREALWSIVHPRARWITRGPGDELTARPDRLGGPRGEHAAVLHRHRARPDVDADESDGAEAEGTRQHLCEDSERPREDSARAERIAGRAEPVREQREGRRCKHRSEEHTSELQSHSDLVCRLLLEK